MHHILGLSAGRVRIMKTYMAKPGEVEQKWHTIDATDQVVGRLASRIAVLLMGKHRPTYTPHVDTGDFVVVINAEKVKFSGKKWEQKEYRWYTGYPGQKSVGAQDAIGAQARVDSERSRSPHAAEEQARVQDDHQAQDLQRLRAPASGPAAGAARTGHEVGRLA